ncbi:MAG TPA: cytochrome c-type biogenesis protein [Rhodocyclaceae bacterium]|nr:cytochrome c-type biogenesis protein [Rhodocyclaceae bacterium]
MKVLLAAILMMFAATVCAGEAQALYSDPATDARLNALASDLRCLVCQNQSIADSHSDLATDLRNEILEMIAAGKTDKEIVDFMVARYGDFVLYRPPFKLATFLLWGGPLLLLALAVLVLYRYFKRSGTEDEK